jgi:hypothetical protein
LDGKQSKSMAQAGQDFVEETQNCTLDYADLITKAMKRT